MAKIIVTFEYAPKPENYEGCGCETELDCALFDVEAMKDWALPLDEFRELSSVKTTFEAVE